LSQNEILDSKFDDFGTFTFWSYKNKFLSS
jgi:hypothetical protein